MVRTQIYLTGKERAALRDLARQTGKTQSELIRRAVADFICRFKPLEPGDRQALLQQAWGMWRERDDLPDFRALRGEFYIRK
jgi:predicted transcriptional regulator